MRLHCLGTAGYHPNDSRDTSCYFLPESGIVLDAGTGIFRLPNFFRGGSLSILLTHGHLDHVFGLTVMLDVFHACDRLGRPIEGLRIFGRRSKLAAVREHLFAADIFPVAIPADWIAIDESSEFELATGVLMSWIDQPHPGGSVAYRIDWPAGDAKTLGERAVGKRLVYATDTSGRDDAAFVEFAGSADLLMHECNFRDSHAELAAKTGHTHTGRLAAIAAKVVPVQTLVTHFDPLCEDSDPIGLDQLPVGTRLAEDGLIVDF